MTLLKLKTSLFSLSTVVLLAILATQAFWVFSRDATGSVDNLSAVDMLKVDTYKERPLHLDPASRWHELGADLSLKHLAYDEVSQQLLEHILYFEINHGEKVQFDDSLPTLLDVYFSHKKEGMRMMAMAVMYEIGDLESLQKVELNLHKQRSESVRDFTIAALSSFHNK